MNLRIIVVDNFYNLFKASNQFDTLLDKVARFKIEGYQDVYPTGVLPFGSHDLVARHYLLCRESKRGFDPIMGYTSISAQKCQEHFLDFPAQTMCKETGTKEHLASVDDLLSSRSGSGADIHYQGSWTIHPEVRKDPELSPLCISVTRNIIIWSAFEFDIQHAITFAVLRFKVDRFHRSVGISRMKSNGEDLPSLPVTHVGGEPCALSIFERTAIPKEALLQAEKDHHLWEDRLQIPQGLDEISSPSETRIAA